MAGIDGFDLRERVHSTARRAVWRAVRKADGVAVFVKRSVEEHPPLGELARLRHEHHQLSSLDLAGVVRPVDLIPDGNGLALVVEDFGGRSLDAELRSGPLGIEAFFAAAIPLTRALASVHEAGLIHRDVNPANVAWNRRDGVVKLLDFELAEPIATAARGESSILVGTLAWIAPEQTGRLDRPVDERSDLYSLGATFYAMLAGRPPFLGDDVAELVHAHLARTPPAPPGPGALQAIVSRLLAKQPDDRYQSAAGVVADLERARDLHTAGRLVPFPLGRSDRPRDFRLPQRLYGRDEAQERLQQAIARAQDGARVFVRVSGWSGVGKTALVNAGRDLILRSHGRFAVGKHQLYRRAEPWFGILSALRQVVGELVAAGISPERRAELQAALQPNAGVLVADLPELEALLGPQSPPEELRPNEARNRYRGTVLRLIEALADPDRPLLLFLDDLQWADPGTLAVLEGLFEEPGRGGLIVVGAWRDNEVGAEHPLRKALKAIQHGDSVDLHLNPLLVRDVRQLLADALERGSTEVKELAEHLHQASGGNPFFLTQLLESVHRAGLLTRGAGGWEWRLPQIVAHPMGDDVGQLMAARLGELIAPTRDAMRVAAVLGADLDFRALVAAREAAPRALLAAVDEASAAGLLHLEGAGWTLLRSAGADDSVPLDGMRLRFVHDAVQAGAYDLTPVAERPALHLRVARLLRPDLRDDAEKLLTVVEHYGYAAHLIEVADERLDVAILHARAGARALESAAFEAARSFFVGGRALLGGDWPDIAWKLVAGECRTATLLGDFEAAGAALEVLREHIAAPEQRFDVYGLDMALSHHQGNLGGVVETGLEALEALGAGMPRFPSQAQIGEAFAALEGALQGRDLATVTQGEWTGDPVEHAVQRFLFAIGPCAYLTQQSALWQTICLTLSRRSLTHGLTPTSAYGFSGLAMLLAGGLAQHERARAFGDAALAIADASGSRAMQATARFMVGGFVVHWTRPYPEAVALVDRGHQDALLAGDVIYASWCLASGAITTTLAGVSLDDAVARAERMEAHATRHGLEDNAMFLPALRQFARALQGRTNGPATMDDGTFTEQGFVRSMEGRFFRVPLHVFQVLRAWLRLLEGDVSGAQDALTAAEQVVGTSFSMPILAEHAALQALVHAAACDSPQGEIWDELQTGRETLATQAAAGPRVYTPRLLLVEAEIARIEGDLAKALGRYEAAMDAALSLGSHLWAAVIAEHAARALERGGSPRAARPWRLDAAHAWLRLGARTRAEALGFDGAGSAETSRGRSLVTSSVRADVALDMETALKAARSIAAELDLDALLARLSHLALENAGAETAWLLLETGDGLRVVSRSEGSGRFVRLDEPFEGSGAPSASVVRLVIGSRAPIVVEDARTDPRFASVPELQERGVRSLMAVPLIHQGRMAGVLVLENNLASGVFTPHRLELLRMLSSQIAVALENARLVEDLRELNTAYARFVPQAFLRFLGKRAITDVRLGDAVEAEMTVLFTDIRSFTTLSEGRSPAENFEFINGYLRAIGPTIRNHGGFIDKYIGDGIMALFPGAAEDAVRAAIAIRKALRSFNEELGRKGQDPIAIGIGLHRGRLMLGTIGEAERMDGTVISDVVNTASRVEGLTKRFACTCLMTGAVTDALPGRDSFLTRYLGQVPVKGRSGHVTIFELFDGDPRELRQAKWATRADFEAAVKAFENGDVTASGAFEALLNELPGDRVLERLMAEAGERAGHG